MSHPDPHSSHTAEHRSWVVHYLGRAERIVLSMIAFVLVLLAVLLLIGQVVALIQAVINGTLGGQGAVDILDGVLLVMMTMEIVYTVTLSLQSHKLIAEPFLIIGVIAAIRRMLVITATSTNLKDQAAFNSTLLELGLLAVIVGVLAFAISTMRRSESLVPEDETKLEDD